MRNDSKILLVGAILWGAFALKVAVAGENDADPGAVELLNKLMTALQEPDEAKSIQAVLPLLHKSLLNADGTDLSRDVKQFSFKKAHGGAPLYANPVKVTRVRETPQTEVGFKATAEGGQVADYFVAKKEGKAGMPAPVKIFFPAGGGAPKILYLGSL
ncbi:MAG: hypothetical protein HYU99_07865 [Deltaproteobacteria bacterium]|nr:hypothetical protein [Deltaproteobacteria bacterium]